MVRLNLDQIRSTVNQNLPRLPKAIGMITFASAGLLMARECTLIALDCTIDWEGLYKDVLTQKGLKTASKVGFMAFSLLSECSPTMLKSVAFGLGAAASGILAFNLARGLFQPIKPPPPDTPSPHRSKRSVE